MHTMSTKVFNFLRVIFFRWSCNAYATANRQGDRARREVLRTAAAEQLQRCCALLDAETESDLTRRLALTAELLSACNAGLSAAKRFAASSDAFECFFFLYFILQCAACATAACRLRQCANVGHIARGIRRREQHSRSRGAVRRINSARTVGRLTCKRYTHLYLLQGWLPDLPLADDGQGGAVGAVPPSESPVLLAPVAALLTVTMEAKQYGALRPYISCFVSHVRGLIW